MFLNVLYTKKLALFCQNVSPLDFMLNGKYKIYLTNGFIKLMMLWAAGPWWISSWLEYKTLP